MAKLFKSKLIVYGSAEQNVVRDIYDVFFLLRYVRIDEELKKQLNKLIKNFEKPIDEEELKILIFDGITPRVKDILLYIKRKI